VRAASLAAELTEEGFDASITPGGKGQFDVLADGTLAFSKHELGRFPDDGEVLALLRAA
jgi:predicted Rdx family selenoprotein